MTILTTEMMADAFGCFWNAAIGEAHERQGGMDTAAIMATGFAAVANRLQEYSKDGGATTGAARLWEMLGATNQDEAIERITILQGVVKGDVWVTPRHRRHYAVTSISGAHIGMWSKREDAVAATREYEGSSLTELVETGPLSTDNHVDRTWLKVGECLAGMGHADVSPAARRKIEAAIKDAINVQGTSPTS